MKKLLVLFLFLFFQLSLVAQGIHLWDNFCTSALVPNSDIEVNVDIDSIAIDSCATLLFYSTNDQQSWSYEDMAPLYLPGYMNTLAQTAALPGSGSFRYGLQSNIQATKAGYFLNVYLSMTPKNTIGQFPPSDNYMIELCQEATGDQNGSSFLDLTEFWGSYSDDKFYFTLNNNDTEWPLYETFSSLPPWYAYLVRLINPETVDSIGYALVYAAIPPFAGFPGVQTGLYKGDITDSSYTRIGDIQWEKYNGKLYMACNIDDLTSDPQFGPWPNSYGCLALDALTATININPLFTINDSTPDVIFYPTHEDKIIGSNTPPQLSDLTFYSVNDSITFSITYTDLDNNLSLVHDLIIDERYETEFELIPQEHSYETGSVFSLTLPLSQITSHAQAVFNDGEYEVLSNVVYITSIDDDPLLQESKIIVSPNPFHSSVHISFLLAHSQPGIRYIITNIKGQVVVESICERTSSGEYSFNWDGNDKNAHTVANGIYFCTLMSDNKFINSKRLLLLR